MLSKIISIRNVGVSLHQKGWQLMLCYTLFWQCMNCTSSEYSDQPAWKSLQSDQSFLCTGLKSCNADSEDYLSRDMRFPTMWYVRPAKAQTSLHIRAVWSEPLQVVWIFYECSATDLTAFRCSKLKSRLYRLAWIYTCQTATLLEITCHSSFDLSLG